MNKKEFDCIVIGGGHAGVEAAHAAAKMGARTALLTISKSTIAAMSCNPAIGGIAKGQIVREIDALGGLMGLATDATGINFKVLNRSKGPAVHAPRAQADRHRYQKWMENYLEQLQNLDIIEAEATDILAEDNKVVAVKDKQGNIYNTQTVVVTTGTFMKGQMYIGDRWWDGGRINEPASTNLSNSLEQLGLIVKRLATGTPPRLYAETINYDNLEKQLGDANPEPFSFMNDKIENEQVPCWITYTNEKIHKVLIDNMYRAPISLGTVKGTKPRYCPSIEAKMLAYPDKKRHRIFLEPEEKEIKIIYANGLFTSVPEDVQDQMIKLMVGTENAKIQRYGYGIEYDYCPPHQLRPWLETRKISGLFLAGQINATSGYEEAAGQGIIAGINAALKFQNKEPFVLGRNQAYIGVMIDDLLTKNIEEPYRMFTSRAEYRLLLRADNADRRLTPLAREIGLVDDKRWQRYQDKITGIEKLKAVTNEIRINGQTIWNQLSQPDSDISEKFSDIPEVKALALDRFQIEAVAIDAKYDGYLKKQDRLVAGFKNLEKQKLPADLDYETVEHLRREAKQKLNIFKPATLGQASRINGVTPADITVIRIHLKKHCS
ncbi:MAG TPA: tRNA uridine-5-carboxymethylaminomethyl(34) synthesis enzyme MnmG [Sedimentisphaerales bacterium]|nr:tRNA uridine-5-carboxymethylaminomethyl(34) synthesis enzyme MnmG [Sedimentisphaerales bacterium]